MIDVSLEFWVFIFFRLVRRNRDFRPTSWDPGGPYVGYSYVWDRYVYWITSGNPRNSWMSVWVPPWIRPSSWVGFRKISVFFRFFRFLSRPRSGALLAPAPKV